MKQHTKSIALSGILAAAAIVVMLLGGLIPVATYVCPMLCCILCYIIYRACGRKLAVVWYIAVSLLSMMIGPDKEAALVFLLFGYYPVLKPAIDRSPLRILWKLLFFNTSVLIICILLAVVFGLDISEEILTATAILNVILVILGNVVFFLMDRVLSIADKKVARGSKHG